MERINKIVKNHISIILPSLVFLTIAIVYSYVKIGFSGDFEKNFYLALTGDTIWQGYDYNGYSPLLSRYFPLMLSHLSVSISVLFGLINVKYLLSVFAFVVFSSHAIFLAVIYLNFPKDKKNIFSFILLSFLLSFFYLQHFILTESFLGGLFIWIVFVIYFYVDFDKLSVFNSISLIIFSVFLVSSYPSVVLFIPMLLVFGIIKYFKTKNITKSNSIVLFFSFFILTTAFLLNVYHIITPNSYLGSANFSLQMFTDLNFIVLMLLVLAVLFFSLLQNIKRYKKILIICTTIFSFAMGYIVLQITPILGYFYRTLSFGIPFLFTLFLIYTVVFKINLEFIYVKIVNFILLFCLLLGSLAYAKNINAHNLKIIDYMENNKTITIEKFQRKNTRYKFEIYYAILISSVFMENNNCKLLISLKDQHHTMLIDYIGKKDAKLKKFGIDIYKFIEIQS
ncbi:hypothetical protein MASR1M68_10320 [Elusimicrobiota bacterium]